MAGKPLPARGHGNEDQNRDRRELQATSRLAIAAATRSSGNLKTHTGKRASGSLASAFNASAQAVVVGSRAQSE